MDILLIPNLSKKNGYECTCEVIRRMTGYGCSCWMMEESMHEFAGQPVKSFPPQGQKIDMIFSIGGDGTLIHSARHAVEMDCPVLGINAGRLGFLTEIEYNALGPSGADCRVTIRFSCSMMLHASAIKQSGRQEFSALNDVVITKGAFGKMVDIDVEMKNGFVSNYRADGLIFHPDRFHRLLARCGRTKSSIPPSKCISVTPSVRTALASRASVFPGRGVHRAGDKSIIRKFCTCRSMGKPCAHRADRLCCHLKGQPVCQICQLWFETLF